MEIKQENTVPTRQFQRPHHPHDYLMLDIFISHAAHLNFREDALPRFVGNISERLAKGDFEARKRGGVLPRVYV